VNDPAPKQPPAGTIRDAMKISERREEPERRLTLRGTPVAFFDALLPPRPKPFLFVVAGLCSAFWLLGLLLAPDRAEFLTSKEWQAQPFFLAAHLIALRLFVSSYARNFLAGTQHTTMTAEEAHAWVRRIFHPLGLAAAVAMAAPLCILDYFEMTRGDYSAYLLGADGKPCAADYLLLAIWCFEWLLNAYIWAFLIGFLLITLYTLKWFTFRDHIETVLHEKHFRPFLLMAVQGSSVLLGFGVANGLYVWYADGELADYIGLGVTIGLLILGFVPPWMQVKGLIERLVNEEEFRLREAFIANQKELAAAPPGPEGPTLHKMAERLEDALFMLRIEYLDRLHADIGRNEGKAILLRLLAPLATIAMKVLRPFFGG
jgi:hypothetical protein